MPRKREPTDPTPKPARKPAKKTTRETQGATAKVYDTVQHKKKEKFLAEFRRLGNIARAAEAAAVGRQSHYDWLRDDPEYAAAFTLATEDAADALEAEAYRRGVEGVEEPVGWYQGAAGGKVRRYSDVMLAMLLKANRPEKFRDNYAIEQRLAVLESALAELVQHVSRTNGHAPTNRLTHLEPNS